MWAFILISLFLALFWVYINHWDRFVESILQYTAPPQETLASLWEKVEIIERFPDEHLLVETVAKDRMGFGVRWEVTKNEIKETPDGIYYLRLVYNPKKM